MFVLRAVPCLVSLPNSSVRRFSSRGDPDNDRSTFSGNEWEALSLSSSLVLENDLSENKCNSGKCFLALTFMADGSFVSLFAEELELRSFRYLHLDEIFYIRKNQFIIVL